MIDIRIVCTHDALGFAETLMRLLGAEQHQVRVSHGRQSLSQLDAAKAERDAVMLIWSTDAPAQHYMLEWARGIQPSRLIEVSRAANAPRSERSAPVIDFSNWRGERGARAWNALNDRLRTVARAMAPPQPAQQRAALALGLASAAAVVGAMVVRTHDVAEPAVEAPQIAASEMSVEALGGPLIASEPASIEVDTISFRARAFRAAPLPEGAAPELVDLVPYQAPDLRDPTLLERIAELNPLRTSSNSD